MLFSILTDFSVSYARPSTEWLIEETSVEPVSFLSVVFLEGCVSICSLCLQFWRSGGRIGLSYVKSLWLEPLQGSEMLLGAWISCAPPGHRGDMEREAERKLKRAAGTGEDTVQQACSDQGKLNCTWAQHVRHKYSSLVSAQLGWALFCFLKECCQFLFGWQIFALFKKGGQKIKKVVVVFFSST